MTNTAKCQQVTALLERQRGYLRDATRAQRDALEAEFFGDEVACHNLMVDAKAATYAALLCADEVADLVGEGFITSLLTTPQGEQL